MFIAPGSGFTYLRGREREISDDGWTQADKRGLSARKRGTNSRRWSSSALASRYLTTIRRRSERWSRCARIVSYRIVSYRSRRIAPLRTLATGSARANRAAIIHGRARRDATRRDACRLSFVGSDSIDPVKEIIAAALRYESVRGNGTTLRAQITRSLC